MHVKKADGIAKFWLHPVEIAFARGFTRSELRRVRELVFEHQTFFLEKWNEYSGH